MGIFKETDYVAIGRDAMPEFFLAELKREKRNYKKEAAKNKKVLAGAFEAFRQGRPENIQAYIADVANTTSVHGSIDCTGIAKTLLRLTEENSDKPAALDLALEGMTQQQRQKTLNAALLGACDGMEGIGGDPFYALLLNAGADPNAEMKANYICSAFVGSIINGKSSLVKLLHESGGNFEKAKPFFDEHSLPHWVGNFKSYRESLEGKPAAVEAGDGDLRQAVIEMRQQIEDLTAAVGRIARKTGMESSTNEPAAPEKPVRERRPYPTVNF
jgi:hypothetical protein